MTARYDSKNKLEKGSMGLWGDFRQRRSPTIALQACALWPLCSSHGGIAPLGRISAGIARCYSRTILARVRKSEASGIIFLRVRLRSRSYKKHSQSRSVCILTPRASEDSKRISGVGFRLHSIESHLILLQRLVHGRARDHPHQLFLVLFPGCWT